MENEQEIQFFIKFIHITNLEKAIILINLIVINKTTQILSKFGLQ